MRRLGQRVLSAGLLALLLTALAGVHIHATTVGREDGACLACVLSSAHQGVDAAVIVASPDSNPDVPPSVETFLARPSLPELTGRSPP
ncbi:MAG: hypothetical protein ACHQPI_14895, partial [Thermoanaerobaculia bacterium]